jgi:N-acyl-D-amino-acid deacylase
MRNFLKPGLLICTSFWLLGSGVSCNLHPKFDIVISNGTLYDGTGDAPVRRDLGILGDTIAALAPPGTLRGRTQIDAEGMSVAPGFINMLSWANVSLIQDGKSQSDIRQVVTLEIPAEAEESRSARSGVLC